jgi:hypothetical protein
VEIQLSPSLTYKDLPKTTMSLHSESPKLVNSWLSAANHRRQHHPRGFHHTCHTFTLLGCIREVRVLETHIEVFASSFYCNTTRSLLKPIYFLQRSWSKPDCAKTTYTPSRIVYEVFVSAVETIPRVTIFKTLVYTLYVLIIHMLCKFSLLPRLLSLLKCSLDM